MITFTRTTQVYDGATGFSAPVVTTITGSGIIISGDPQQFAALGLVQEQSAIIGFTPTSYPLAILTDNFVRPGDTTTINGVQMTVRKIPKLVAPDGYVIFARIAVST